ncbi:MAG: AlpA family transcriptional regulator [Alphaproteobacteria bacterium]|nr:AlpA family transcriptional regulator [Alphaproteobacteria bacterium]
MFEMPQKERFLRLSDVKKRTGLSRSTIYLNISKGTFPRHISLGARCVGWLESEIDAWMQARIDTRSTQVFE